MFDEKFLEKLEQQQKIPIPDFQEWVYDLLIEKGFFTPSSLKEFLSKEEKKESPTENLFAEMLSSEAQFEMDTFSSQIIISQQEKTIFDTELKKNIKASLPKKMELHNLERYQLIETLGEGGMGIVQLVYDRILGREVALKRVKLSNSEKLTNTQQILLWRLSREALITATLEHPNIVPLYEMQQKDNGELCFTMRKIEGETLKSYLQKQKELPTQRISESKNLSIFLKICDAVAYAHNRGVIHRDLKPENIMVGEFGEVYVMDWGIAKETMKASKTFLQQDFGAQTYSQQTIGGIGTPGYMPPEQGENASEIKIQADIYTLGKILKECYTLLSPIEELKLLLKHYSKREKNQKAQMELSLDEKLPLDIRAIVKKATAEEEKDRYESVLSLTQDIESYLRNQRVSVRHYSPFELLTKWLQRNKQQVFVATIFLALCLGFPLYFRWSHYQDIKENFKQNFRTAQAFRETSYASRETRIQQLLNGLNALNYALALRNGDLKAELEKLKISEELIHLCCESEDYQLANYLLGELKGLIVLTKQKQKALEQQIETAKNKLLTKHQARFHYWIKILKSPKRQAGSREKALREISRMTEEVIFQKLLKILNEGTTKILQKRGLEIKEREYYEIMVTALGWLERPAAGRPLFQALVQMEKKLSKLPPKKKQLADISFMVTLAKALGDSKAKNLAVEFQYMRERMGLYSKFGEETLYVYQTLADLDGLATSNVSKAEEYRDRGDVKYEQGDLKGAIEDQTKAIQLNASDPFAYNFRGMAKMDLKQFSEALIDFQKAMELAPTSPEFLNNRGLAYYHLRRYQEALKDFNQVILMQSRFAEAYGNRGVTQQQLNEPALALQDYNIAIYLNPQMPKIYLNRGVLHFSQNRYNEAIQDFSYSIELSPKSAEAYYYRGNAWYRKGEIDKALADYIETIHLDPQFAQAYYHRALVKSNLKDFNGAIEDYFETIRLDPEFANAYYYCGICYGELKQFKKAIEIFTRLIKKKPNFGNAFLARGSSQQSLGFIEKAIEDYNKAIQVEPSLAKAYLYRGIANNKKNLWEKSFQDCQIAIQKNPLLTRAYLYAGVAKSKQEKYKTAIQYFSKAIKLSPVYDQAYFYRGLAYKNLGMKAEAFKDFEKTSQLNQKFAQAYYHQGILLYHQKKYEAALKNFQQTIDLDSTLWEAYFQRARVKARFKQFQSAIQDFTLVLGKDPTYFPAYLGRADAKMKKGLRDGAIEDFIKAIELNPTYQKSLTRILPDLLLKRGLEHFRKQNWKAAQKDFQQFQQYALPSHPNFLKVQLALQQIESILKKEERK